MPDLKIHEERPVTMAEMKEHLENIEKRDKELNLRAKKTKEYLDQFVKIKFKKVEEVKKKIEGLNIGRLKEKHITKVIDLKPNDVGELRSIFSDENITLKQEDLEKIIEALKELK